MADGFNGPMSIPLAIGTYRILGEMSRASVEAAQDPSSSRGFRKVRTLGFSSSSRSFLPSGV